MVGGGVDPQTVSVLKTEGLLFFTLLQLAAIILAGRLGGLAAQRLGQSPAVGEIVAGILLGPTLAGLVSPQAFAYVFQSTPPEPLQILAQVGLLLLMFQIGLEFEFSHLLEGRNRTAVIRVAAAGLVAPFALGLAFGYATAPILSPEADRLASGLFVATAFSITALPILGRIMIELGIQRTALGVIAISAAAINDLVGWLVLALVTTLTLARFDALGFGLQVLLLALYLLGSWWLVRPLLCHIVARAAPNASHLPPGLLGMVLAAVFLSGMATIELGIFGIFGGFLMGVLLHRERAWWKPGGPGWSPSCWSSSCRSSSPTRASDRHRRAGRARRLGLVRPDPAARHPRQARGHLCRGTLVRPRALRGQQPRDHDEHPGPDGAGGAERGV
jgi:Kef-type K+ transport system membrane component KefB